MAPQAEAEPVVIGRVMEAFGLGAPSRVEPVAEGLMNRNWRVAVDAGVFAVKEVLDVKPEQALFQHRATRALAAEGLAVPAPVRTGGGETLVRCGGAVFAVLPWVDGECAPGIQWDRGRCAEAGRTLGRIHTALARILPEAAGPVRPQVPTAAGARADIDRYLGIIARRDTRDAFDAFAAEQLHERRALLEQIGHLRPQEGRTLEPAGYVHGDFHDLNLLWDQRGRIAAVLDWDRMRVRAWALELARTVTLVFGASGAAGGMDLQRAAAFAAGYRAVAEVDGGQIAAAAHLLWWERVCDFWQLQWHYERGEVSCDHLFSSASALLSWWNRHRGEVEAALTAR